MARALAHDLGLNYLDTGAMYRCLALKAQRAGLTASDGDAAAALGQATTIEFRAGDPQPVFLDGEDVTSAIRTPDIGELASALSVFPAVRRILVARQQEMVAQGGFTLEGRDVTTVVAPNADVKIYLTASLEERAKRRHLELEEKGMPHEFGTVRQEMLVRDHRDITRDDSPLTVAPGAVVVETAGLSPDEVVKRIKDLIPKD